MEEGPLGWAVVDTDFRFVKANATFCKLLGYEEAELLRYTVWDLTHPDDRPRNRTLAEGSFGDGDPSYRYEKRYLRKDGGHARVTLHAFAIRDEGGQVRGSLGVVEDVTRHHQAAQVLRLQSVILNNMTEGVCLVRASDGTIVHANPRFEAMFGYGPGEMSGLPVSSINYDDGGGSAEQAARDITEQLERHGEAHYEVHNARKDGTPFWCSAHTTRFEHPDHGWVYVAVQTDITERKAQEERIRQLDRERERRLADLARSNHDLEQFAYAAAHDLREPLRTMAGFAQLVARQHAEKLDVAAVEFLEYITDAGHRLGRLIEDLLEYSRLGHGEMELSPVDCNALYDRVVGDLQARIDDCQAQVTRDALPTVPAHPALLALRVQNLVDNALKFRGAEPPRIHLSADRQHGEWVFAARDNGPGFEPEKAERIFQLFQRLHPATSGTGVGLATCKTVVERHGGRIWASSQPGHGATFYFALPAADRLEAAP